MTTDSLPITPRPAPRVSRSVWIGAGALGIASAALAGALVMRAVDAPVTPQAPGAAPWVAMNHAGDTPATGADAPAAPRVGTPVPLTSSPAAGGAVARAGAPVPADTMPAPARAVSPAAAVCKTCGVVESVATVSEKGEGSGLGAVAGGVLGGVLGHQVGGGHGKTALTVLGAVGGGLAGNEVEKRARATTHYDVHVHMADGSHHVYRREQPLAVGAKVVVEGATLRLARNAGGADPG